MNELELRDIHLPDSSLWWPPAPAWWMALALLLAIGLLVVYGVHRIRHKPLKSLCLIELKRVRQSHIAGHSDEAVIRDVATLLRRTVISLCGRAGPAASTGAEWLGQLKKLSRGAGFSDDQLQLLIHHRYQRHPECDIDSLLQACEDWIKSLPRSSTHVSD